ncbi:hypothetical protein BDC45DRAFT_552302 [Circinella umbellata]|nr:hypothetical protein BDC45DRAFT_552302 [Circinella umbellata]
MWDLVSFFGIIRDWNMTFGASMHTYTIIAYQDHHFSSYIKNKNLNYHFKKWMNIPVLPQSNINIPKTIPSHSRKKRKEKFSRTPYPCSSHQNTNISQSCPKTTGQQEEQKSLQLYKRKDMVYQWISFEKTKIYQVEDQTKTKQKKNSRSSTTIKTKDVKKTDQIHYK